MIEGMYFEAGFGIIPLIATLAAPMIAGSIYDKVLRHMGDDPMSRQLKMQLKMAELSKEERREASQKILAYMEEQSDETAAMMAEIREENWMRQRELHMNELIMKPVIADYLSKPQTGDYLNQMLKIGSGGIPFDPKMPVPALLQA